MQRRTIVLGLVALATALTLSGLGSTALAQSTPSAQAEVTKIDKAGGRITLKHGEIKNLDMPPMTMVFRVRDPKFLEAVGVGDRVTFTAEKINGNYTVTSISRN